MRAVVGNGVEGRALLAVGLLHQVDLEADGVAGRGLDDRERNPEFDVLGALRDETLPDHVDALGPADAPLLEREVVVLPLPPEVTPEVAVVVRLILVGESVVGTEVVAEVDRELERVRDAAGGVPVRLEESVRGARRPSPTRRLRPTTRFSLSLATLRMVRSTPASLLCAGSVSGAVSSTATIVASIGM